MQRPTKKMAGFIATASMLLLITVFLGNPGGRMPISNMKTIKLPAPDTTGTVPLETTLLKRRTIRHLQEDSISLAILAQLLWSAQGVSDPRGFRTAPSAGALYPLNIQVVAGNIANLAAGIYRYLPHTHSLTTVIEGDFRKKLCRASLQQDVVCQAPAVLIITGIAEKTTSKYGDRGFRYMYMETGHAAQNICLQAVSLDIGTVTIGAFHDDEVAEILHLNINENPLYLIPVGKIR